jgi:hypothetical protein
VFVLGPGNVVSSPLESVRVVRSNLARIGIYTYVGWKYVHTYVRYLSTSVSKNGIVSTVIFNIYKKIKKSIKYVIKNRILLNNAFLQMG